MEMITPNFDDFSATYAQGKPQLVWIDLISDLDTPVAAYLKLANSCTNSFLLESVQDGDIKGRFSIIGMEPDLIFRVRDGECEVNRDAQNSDIFSPLDKSPIEGLRQMLDEATVDIPDSLPTMSAGIFGYLAYDMVKEMERLSNNNPRAIDVPDSLFIRPTLVAVFDTVTDSLKLVSVSRPTDGLSAEEAYFQIRERLLNARMRLSANVDLPSSRDIELQETPSSNMVPEQYYANVKKARDYIEAGDIFQVVLSQRFEIDFELPAFDLYRALRRVNPSPYLFFLNFDGFSVVGSSPEVLVGVTGREVNIRPIAGTRHRGKTSQEDEAIAADLLSDEKERAEHLMLLDLGRNDVGKVSDIGSVKVNTAFGIQKTSHLIHIVSDVTGILREDLDVIDALQSGFPAGTVSGAPKIRAMEIIEELEPDRRGIYAGCVGYFSAGGDMDTCIALRTGIVKDGKLFVQAGGGVVYDSTPEYEFEETVNKAKALFRAADEAAKVARDKRNAK